LFRHLDFLEDAAQLLRSSLDVPPAVEVGQVLADLLKGDAIAPVVAVIVADRNRTAGKNSSDRFDNIANPIILIVVSHVEYLVGDRLSGSFETGNNGIADIFNVDQRSPRRAVARHPDAA